MTTWTIGRYWHVATLVVAVFALVFQLYLVATGDNILDSSAVTTARPEQVRRFFSYFTIQSNVLVAVSTFLIVRGRIESQVFRVVRLASLVGITVTGIVAAIALPPSPSYTTGSLICDRLLHIVVPVLTFVGWAVFGPRGKVTREDLLPALIWPALWLVATLALGPLVDWYPYPFLDVGAIGLGRTLLNCAVIALLFLALAALALWADRRLSRDRATMNA
ncbi:Pr6Pr family membrane protein [Terrabacter sp. Ter38]|uniref:Pr6Pr family membrane protein n=1 Tax=Terrabacter sp. Ter38 TaxID=2926030 RepID=UPI002117D483|nr:Pr6Pr family membrane protein [Terrabacter sp. Ter38]